jgi:hypothetical protein
MQIGEKGILCTFKIVKETFNELYLSQALEKLIEV